METVLERTATPKAPKQGGNYKNIRDRFNWINLCWRKTFGLILGFFYQIPSLTLELRERRKRGGAKVRRSLQYRALGGVLWLVRGLWPCFMEKCWYFSSANLTPVSGFCIRVKGVNPVQWEILHSFYNSLLNNYKVQTWPGGRVTATDFKTFVEADKIIFTCQYRLIASLPN